MRHSRKRLARPAVVVIFLLSVTAATLLWQSATTTSPADSLSRALDLATNKHFDEIDPLLSVTSRDKRIEHWGQLLRARVLEQQGLLEEAKGAYLQVSANSAASLDARIALLRLAVGKQENPGLGAELSALEIDVIRHNRADLLGELYYLRGKHAAERGEVTLAYSLFQELRGLLPDSAPATRAKKAVTELTAANLEQFPADGIPFLMSEANLLFAEGDLISALEKVQLVKSKTGDGESGVKSAAYLQALLLEEQILRSLKRHEEADRALLLLSADGTIGTADVALLKIAKNNWNVNDHYQALTFLEQLKGRFIDSPLLNEALYVEGRILEELNLLTEAKAIYLELAKRASDHPTAFGDRERKITALNRVAYMYLRSGNFSRAHEYFNASAAEASRSDPNLSHSEQRKLRDLAFHAKYWAGFTARQINDNGKAEEIWRELSHDLSPHYYKMLVERETHMALGNSRKNLLVQGRGKESTCMQTIPPSLTEALGVLADANLTDLAQHEIDWHYPSPLPSESLKLSRVPMLIASLPKQLEPSTLHQLLSKVDLSIRFGNKDDSIDLVELLLQAPSLLPQGEENECYPVIFSLAYPTPYLDMFKDSAATEGVPLALLYAIVRTESHFNTNAVSKAGARGLAQLMPATAKEEGLEEGGDLFQPAINLRIGAKHLARLLGFYEGKLERAVAAYNAGGGAVNRWNVQYPDITPSLWIELIGYPETKSYVKKVLLAREVYELKLGTVDAGEG